MASIQGINNSTLLSSLASQNTNKTETANFADIFTEIIGDTADDDAIDKMGNIDLLTGDLDMLHTSTINAEKAELSLRLTIQIRNKVVDAYSEIMRMQV